MQTQTEGNTMKHRYVILAALVLLALAAVLGGWTWDDRIVAASWVSGTQFGW